MIVVDPIEINDTNYQSSSIAEPDTVTGEKEYVAIPFDGYNLSSDVPAPGGVTKARGRDAYCVLDPTAKRLYWFNGSFSLTGTYEGSDWSFPSVQPKLVGSWGLPDSHGRTGVGVLESYGSVDPFWVVRAYNESARLDQITFNGSPLSIFNPVGHAAYLSGSKQYFVVLSDDGGGAYRVKGYDATAPNIHPTVLFDTPLTLGGRVPVDIDCRRGEFTILYKSGVNTSISFYNSTFTTELSNHPITGNNPDSPYDAFTVDNQFGFKMLRRTTKKIYNVDSSYNHGSTYKVGDQVIKAALHKKYQCLIDTTQDPVDGVDAVPPTWFELGATNRWAMFDGINTYQSEAPGSIEIAVRPVGVVSAINIFNMENIDQVVITSSVPDTGDSYSETFDTTGKVDLVAFDFPPYENPTVDVSFIGTDIKVGEVVFGTATRLGVLLSGAISDRIDYSRYTYDEFGKLTYVKRPIVKYITYPIRVMKIDAPGVERYLDGLQGKQAVWIGGIGDDDYLVVRGNLERSPMTYDNPSIVEYQIKVRGSI